MFGFDKKETVYPTWRYHKDQQPKCVYSEDEDKLLGKGWADKPYENGAEPSEGLGVASADSDKVEPSDVLHPEDPDKGAMIKTELKPVDSKNKVIEKRSEDDLVKEILERKLSDLKESTLKRKTKRELLNILEGK